MRWATLVAIVATVSVSCTDNSLPASPATEPTTFDATVPTSSGPTADVDLTEPIPFEQAAEFVGELVESGGGCPTLLAPGQPFWINGLGSYPLSGIIAGPDDGTPFSAETPRFDCSYRNGNDVIHLSASSTKKSTGATFEAGETADSPVWLCSAWIADAGWRYYARVESVDPQCRRNEALAVDAARVLVYYLGYES